MYPHWYSQVRHLSKTRRMTTTRHHHLEEKSDAKPLAGSAADKQQRISDHKIVYDVTTVFLSDFVSRWEILQWMAMKQFIEKREQTMEWSSTCGDQNPLMWHFEDLRSTKRVPRNATASTAVRKLKNPKLPLPKLCCGSCDGLWHMGRTPQRA